MNNDHSNVPNFCSQTPQHISAGDRLNYEKNMNDALAVIHKLQTGLDVNVKFTGVADFE